VVLPQAFRNMIPVLLTQTIVLFMRWLERRVRVPGLIAAGGAPMPGH
jgi:hypothetical protein